MVVGLAPACHGQCSKICFRIYGAIAGQLEDGHGPSRADAPEFHGESVHKDSLRQTSRRTEYILGSSLSLVRILTDAGSGRFYDDMPPPMTDAVEALQA